MSFVYAYEIGLILLMLLDIILLFLHENSNPLHELKQKKIERLMNNF